MEETIPLLEENVNQISAQLASTGIRGDWKETRENYSRIESSKAIEYSHAVIAAYSIGTTPIHAFLLRHLFSSHVYVHPSVSILECPSCAKNRCASFVSVAALVRN